MPLKENPIVFNKPDNNNLKLKYKHNVALNFFKQSTYLEGPGDKMKKPFPIINNTSSMYTNNKRGLASGKAIQDKTDLFMRLKTKPVTTPVKTSNESTSIDAEEPVDAVIS